MISLNYVIKEIIGHKTRMLLIILAIAWGTAAIASMLAIGEGLRVTLVKAMEGAGKGILIIEGGKTSLPFKGTGMNKNVLLNKHDLLAIQHSVPGILATSGEYNFEAPLINIHFFHSFAGQHRKKTFSLQKAVDPDYGKIRNLQLQKGGRFINPRDIQEKRRVIILGDKIASQLFPADNPLNKSLMLGYRPFKVVGVTKPKLELASYGGPDAYQVWIPSTTYESLSGQQYYQNIIILPEDPQKIQSLQRNIQTLFARRHHLNPEDNEILEFQNLFEVQLKTEKIFLGMQIFLGIIGAISLLIAGIGISNVMFVSVKQATREIGTQIALGATSYDIIFHYLAEALMVTFMGGIIGLIVAYGLIKGINHIPLDSAILQFTGKPEPILSSSIFMIVLITLGVIGFFSSLFPARKAAQINPIEALRHE